MFKRLLASAVVVIILLNSMLPMVSAMQDTTTDTATAEDQAQSGNSSVSVSYDYNATIDEEVNPKPHAIPVNYDAPNVIDDKGNKELLSNEAPAYFLEYGSYVSPITTVVNPDGTITICVDPGGDNVYIHEINQDFQVTNTLTIPKEFDSFGAFAKDPETGLYYIFYGEDAAEGDDTTENLALVEYNSAGEVTRSDSFAVPITEYEDGLKKPFEATGCSMEISGDYLYVTFGKEMHKAEDGINHQSACGVVYQLSTFTQVTVEDVWEIQEKGSWNTPHCSHIMEQLVIPIDDGFALVQKGDASRGFSVSEVTSGSAESKLIFEVGNDEGTGGQPNNYCYSEIGGLAETSTGYIFVGTYEQEADEVDSPSAIHVGSRDLFVQTISADLQTVSEPIYLTDNTNKDTENVANPKMVQCGDDEYVILYENIQSDGTYTGTYYLVVDELGNVTTPITQLPDNRLNKDAELVYNHVNDTVLWTTNSPDDLIVWEFDPTAPVVEGTDTVTVNVKTPNGEPLEGATVTYGSETFTANGATHTMDLPYGMHEIVVSKEGYATTQAIIGVGPETTVDVVVDGAAIQVLVQEAGLVGKYLPGAKVTMEDGTVLEPYHPENQGGLGAIGEFYMTISSEPEGTFTLTSEKDGYITKVDTWDYDVVVDDSFHSITMRSSTDVTFTASDNAKAPVTFTAYFDDETTPNTSNQFGNLEMPDFQAGAHTAKIEAEGYETTYTGPFNINTADQVVNTELAPTGSPVSATGIAFEDASTTVEAGEIDILEVNVSPANATDKRVSFTSSNPEVATVDPSNGTVTAVADGTTTITATTNDGSHTATCEVTVGESTGEIPVTGITLNKTSTTIGIGGQETLVSTVSPADATNKTVNWSSSNTEVATVSNTGTVTAVGPGTATITATTADGLLTADCEVTVTGSIVPVTGITIDESSTTINVGETDSLTATISPADATNKKVNWSSSNKSVATVSSSGVVTGKAPGTATITATTVEGGFTDTSEVTVNDSSPPPVNPVNPVNPVMPGDTTISGTGIPGNTITVIFHSDSVSTFASETIVTTTVDASGNWSVTVPSGITLEQGDTITIQETDPEGNLVSESTITVQSAPPPTGETPPPTGEAPPLTPVDGATDTNNPADSSGQGANSPSTGDETNIVLLLVVLGASIVAIVILVLKKKNGQTS